MSSRTDLERLEALAALAKRKVDEDVQPLIVMVEAMPDGPEKRKAMHHLHGIIGGFSSTINAGLLARRAHDRAHAERPLESLGPIEPRRSRR